MNKEIKALARDLMKRIKLLIPDAEMLADKGLEEYKSAQASGISETSYYDFEISSDYLDDVVCKLKTAIEDLNEVI